MSGPLPADLVRAIAAAGLRLGAFDRIEYFGEVDSTNDLALQAAGRGAPHGTVVLADAQRAGRGRHGRTWFSPPGAGLYLSIVLRSTAWAGALSLVTLAAGVGVARGLAAATGLTPELKWPNDVVIGRPWRKVAGILSESASSGSRIDAVVVGIGVNLRKGAFPQQIAGLATAIEMETDRPVDSAACLVEILAAIAEVIAQLGRGDRAGVVEAWRQYGRAGLAGSAVRWHDEGGSRRGVARDVDETGALVVDADGRRERVVAGEVEWELRIRD